LTREINATYRGKIDTKKLAKNEAAYQRATAGVKSRSQPAKQSSR
jgi:hypothetical protein